jgi:diadenosine tetraphosphate (Ap4A) HIT family hydrolase
VTPTARKFGYPDTLVREYRHWVVLLRPAQSTLGALVLASTEPAQSFSEVSAEGFGELALVTRDLESAVRACFGPDKLNYLMLMMVDPDVHFHVLPRYAEPRRFAGAGFVDPGWPGPPNLAHAPDIDPTVRQTLLTALRDAWPN